MIITVCDHLFLVKIIDSFSGARAVYEQWRATSEVWPLLEPALLRPFLTYLSTKHIIESFCHLIKLNVFEDTANAGCSLGLLHPFAGPV